MNILLVGGLNVNPERFLPIIDNHNVYGIWESSPKWLSSVRAGGPYEEIESITVSEVLSKNIDVVWSLLSPWDGLTTTLCILEKYPKLPVIRQTQGAITPWWHESNCTKRPLDKPTGNYRFGELRKVLEASSGLMFNSEMYRDCLIAQGVQIENTPYILSNGMAYNSDITQDIKTEKFKHPHVALIGRGKHSHNKFANKRIHVYYHSTTECPKNEYLHKRKYLGDIRFLKKKPIKIKKILEFKQKTWCKAFSKYTAGLMHVFNPCGIDVFNGIDINIPGRVNTYLACGIPPVISNRNSSIADFVKGYDFSLAFSTYTELREKLCDTTYMNALQRNVIEQREKFSMQYEFNKSVLPFFESFL